MAREVNIRELAQIIRSKNAGPFLFTFDIVYKDYETYEKVKKTGIINADLIAKLYDIPRADVVSFVNFDPAKAMKATIKRPHGSGCVGDTDVYGAQQHGPLLSITVPLD